MLKSKLKDKIIIGTAQFGLNYGIANSKGKMKTNEIKKIIKYARTNNIKNIDTAHAYGDSEQRLGNVGIKNFNVIVKLPATNPTQPYDQWVKKSIHSSFKKLKINKADTVLVHNAKFLLNPKMGKKIYEELKKFKNKNIINNIGVSIYSISDLKNIIKKFSMDVVLISLNIFDQRILNKKIINTLKRKNIKIYTRSTFLQGLLLMSKNKIPTKFNKWKKKFDMWFRELENKKVSAYDACLDFVMKNKDVDKTLIGIDDFKQFKEIFEDKPKININYKKFNSNKINKLINPAKW
jgi:aryl-alcohol dehydrogenase-like predicted oxidoreductase